MVIVTGDWHSKFDQAYRNIKKLGLENCSIIQVGDFGIGFERPKKEERRLKVLNEHMLCRNIMLYVIRGNHDDPKYFDGNTTLSNIKLLSDYTVIELQGYNFLCIGGAISVDRFPNPDIPDFNGRSYKGRTLNVNYWTDESFVLDVEKIEQIVDVDIVITHSAPNFCKPYTKKGIEKWFKHDSQLEGLCIKERSDHTILYEMLKKKNNIHSWYYGHYHHSESELLDGTKFVMLDELEFYEVRI